MDLSCRKRRRPRPMKLTAAFFLIASALALPAFAQTASPPSKPIFVSTEIGQVASKPEKMEIAVGASITSKEVNVRVVLKDTQMFGKEHQLTIGEASALAVALRQVEAESTAPVATPAATVSKIEGDVVIAFKSTGLLSNDTVKLDRDNAEFASQLITKAANVAAWLAPRAAGLQK